MSIEKIHKLFLIAPESRRAAILEILQKKGVVQIQDISGRSGESADEVKPAHAKLASPDDPGRKDGEPDWDALRCPSLPDRRTLEKTYENIVSSIEFIKPYVPMRSGFELLSKGPETVTPDKWREILEAFDHEAMLSRIRQAEDEIKSIHTHRVGLETRREHLLPWVGIGVPVDMFSRTTHVVIKAISVPIMVVDACQEAASKAIDGLWAKKVGETRRSKNIVIMYHRNFEKEAERIIHEFDVHPAVFPCEHHTPAEMISHIEQELKELGVKLAAVEDRLARMREDLLNLFVIADHMANALERVRVHEICGRTASTFLLRGWIPVSAQEEISREVGSVAPEADLTFSEPEPDEDVPVILKNSALARPFEAVIDLYGKPAYSELDPTSSIAVFFFIGFGYCLSDAGYGLIMTILFGYASWKFKLTEGVRKFCWMMTLSGISATIVGILTGGWFGNLLTASNLLEGQKSAVMPFLLRLQIIDPLGDQLMLFLGIALGIGYIQLAWGSVLCIYDNLRHGRYMDAFTDPLSWLLMAGGLPVALFNQKAGIIVSCAGIAGMILFAGRENKNIFMRFFAGLWAVYNNVMGFVSDVLSYTRLFALGLATGIMCTVVNTIAFIIWDSVPYVGWLICIIILLVAHPINFMLNVLGAFIHTIRLQFVEFFPKFYKSGGQAFVPLALKHEWVAVKEAESAGK